MTTAYTWDFTRKLLTRFFCIYFLLYIFPFPLDLFSENNFVITLFSKLWGKIVPFTGKHLLHVEVGHRGSDTLFHNVRILSILIIALIGSLIWTAVDRKRDNYNKLFYWITVYTRYYLAFNMLDYGFSKVFNVQFTPLFPHLEQLVQPYGDFSPQGLLWKFMGYSKSYQVFTGVWEVLGGLLLLFRRTTLLGALVCIALLSNVFMMNWSYDIPVKIYSAHLLFMAIFLLAPGARRMVNFFILNKPVYPVESFPSYSQKWIRTTMLVLKIFFAVYLVYIPFKLYSGYSKEWYSNKKPPLYGIYNVETFVLNTDSLPPLTTDSIRWKRMIVEFPGMWANVQLMNEKLKTYDLKTDTVKKSVVFSYGADSLDKFILHYEQPQKDMLTFTGKWKMDSVYIQMRRVDINQFRLVRWKSGWITRGNTNY